MLTDSHCHLDRLDLSSYGGDLALALQAAKDRGVERFLCIAIDAGNTDACLNIAKEYEDVYATVGLHPMSFDDDDDRNESENRFLDDNLEAWLKEKADNPVVLGLGETGLDYYYSTKYKEAQQSSFCSHLEVAKSLKKPVIVHTRSAKEDTLQIIKEHACPESSGVLHCFTEDWDMAKRGMDLNFYISFSGIITFKNASELREVVKKTPIERLLVETDSPYLAPVPYRGKENEPKYVLEVAKCVAEIKNISLEQVYEQTNRNFDRLFKI